MYAYNKHLGHYIFISLRLPTLQAEVCLSRQLYNPGMHEAGKVEFYPSQSFSLISKLVSELSSESSTSYNLRRDLRQFSV
ncbi:Protein of unknown function [Pyronema omphalodes CBS 100304]|uniref:Uncharacterized protein n=1 Tax=Pyronema omphalodes (strain CBS 100304) TaxID=1076935 RepID=U4LQ85_PYROM|nr:Protein of unknown function [Pyronema omphalodes CBS 100304]